MAYVHQAADIVLHQPGEGVIRQEIQAVSEALVRFHLKRVIDRGPGIGAAPV